MKKVHIITDDRRCRERTSYLIDSAFGVEYHNEPNKVLENIESGVCIIVDETLTGEYTESFLTDLRIRHGTIPIVVILSKPNISSAVHYTQIGATDCLPKPLEAGALTQSLTRAVELNESREVRETCSDETGIVGVDVRTGKLRRTIDRLSRKDSPVLIYGESGVGKELVARAIHRLSSRSQRPFIAVNCAAVPETLFESEFFGVRRGAYTDAIEKEGFVSIASEGTLFLDEIGELPLPQQAKLLRVLEDGAVTPLGDTRSHTVDFRLISATNRNLYQLVQQNRFRKDFYYRISTAPLKIDPLRLRRDDLWPIVDEFFRRKGETMPTMLPDARRRLERYDWPGNVRELFNVLERALILSENDQIRGSDIVFDAL